MENYWKVQEVAAALQISAQTVYRYVANGEIPFRKLNKSVRFNINLYLKPGNSF